MVEQPAGFADDVIPLEGRAGVHLVGLNVEMAEDALVCFQFAVRQLLENEFARGIPRVVAFDFRQRLAERGGEFDQGLVLLGRKVVLDQLGALDCAGDRLGPRGVAHKAFGADAAVAKLLGNGDARPAVRLFGIPLRKGIIAADGIGAHVGDLDADGAVVGRAGMPRALFDIQCLVNRTVQVEHEMDAQVAHVVQNLEALPARATDVIVNDKLVHDPLQKRQVPAATTDPLDLLV